MGSIDDQDVIQGPAGLIYVACMEIILCPFKSDIFPFGILRKVDNVDNSVGVGRSPVM